MAIVDKMEERIVAVPRINLFGTQDERAFQGFQVVPLSQLSALVPIVARRGDLEENPLYKQPISYVLIYAEEEESYLAYRRLKGDNRLTNSISLGVGGHVHIASSGEVMESVAQTALRELEEEVHFPYNIQAEDLTYVGCINDDSNEVGKVHFGVVYTLHIPSIKGVEVKETESLSMFWLKKCVLQKKEELQVTFENWSKLLVEHLV